MVKACIYVHLTFVSCKNYINAHTYLYINTCTHIHIHSLTWPKNPLTTQKLFQAISTLFSLACCMNLQIQPFKHEIKLWLLSDFLQCSTEQVTPSSSAFWKALPEQSSRFPLLWGINLVLILIIFERSQALL